MKRAYHYRFYPTDEQAHNLACTFGCVRFIYNFALNKRKRAYFDQGIKLYTKDLSAALTALKKEEGTAWLREVSSVPLQQALRHLDTAYRPPIRTMPSRSGMASSPLPSTKSHSLSCGRARCPMEQSQAV
jgi:transposase